MLGIIFSKNIIVLSLIFHSILCNDQYDDRIYFDGPTNVNGNRNNSPASGMTLEMEIELAQEYNKIENIEDILSRINGVPDGVNLAEAAIASRFGGNERSIGEIPKPANCKPELQPVSLKNSTVSSTVNYIPSCTRVPRCGGCCGHAALSCQPTDTIIRNFQVVITEYDIIHRLTYKRKEIVPIEEHTKCACSCTTKAEHCNEKQNYLPKECRCACANIDEETKCQRNNDTKIWDEKSCVCKCRGSTECTTGSYYDHNTCSCKTVGAGGLRRQVGQAKIRPYSTSFDQSGIVPPMFTIGADDPRRKHREDPE